MINKIRTEGKYMYNDGKIIKQKKIDIRETNRNSK